MSNTINNAGTLATSILNDGLSGISNQKTSILQRFEDIKNGNVDDQNLEMTKLNFEVSQYTTSVELISNLLKNLTDTAKSLAQKM